VLKSLTIFSGNANRQLALDICKYVEIPLGASECTTFSDGELYCEIGENVRGSNCFVVQPTCTPVNRNLMELLIMVDTLKRSSAGSIVVVVPYYGYARQDRKVKPRTPITSRLVADLITAAGADRVLAMDLHAGQIQGFFNIPFDHLYSMPVLVEHLRARINPAETVFVSPDAGGVERTRAYSKRLPGTTIAMIDKRRTAANVSEVMHIIGDVAGRDAVIIDDMIDTAGTLCNAARAVLDAGGRSVSACATLMEVTVTDTIPLSERTRSCPKIQQLSVARLLGEAIKRIHHGDSISSLFI